ncbi:MAG: glycosyltransferase [Aurantibacter sp.]
MRVGFDAKRIFHNDTGLGNYGRDVIRILHEHTSIDKFILYNTKPSKTKRLEILNRILVRYPDSWFWKRFSSIWRLGPATRQIAKDKVDIYHGLSGETPTGLKDKGIASIVTIHDLIFLSHPQFYSWFDRTIYKRKFRHAARNAKKVIAISQQTKRDIVKYLNIDSEKISVVYQGCNEAYKKTYGEEQMTAVAKKYRLPEQFILNVGTLQERKNALTILRAIKGSNYTLVLVGGEKKYATRIHTYINRNGLQGQVIFLKKVPVTDLAVIYQLAMVFCYPSICEGFGIPIIEALFSKTPVITSRGSCFPEAGGATSIYIEPHDDRVLREKLDLLFNDAALRDQMVQGGLEHVQKFTDELVANNVLEVYREVINEGQGIVPEKEKISALMITYNEIEHIDTVLENLSFADEVVVVDSFSTDGTVERIKEHENVKLIQRPFKDFTDQKSFALSQASHDWVLFMDADERVTNDLKHEILDIVNNGEAAASAYYFYRTFMFENKVLNFSGWQTDKNYRLFRKSKVHFAQDRIVHETLIVDGDSDNLENKLIHYSYKNYEDYKNKMIKYGKMKALEESGKSYMPNAYHFILRPFYKFMHHYIVRLGILDGKKGIIICYLNALGVYSRYKELKRLKTSQKTVST